MSGLATPQGWYPDPYSRHVQRWWDGTNWTASVSNGPGHSGVDPLGAGPSAVPTLASGLNTMGVPTAQMVVTQANKSPGMAIASLVLGIGALFFAFIPLVGFLSVPFALIGLGLGLAGYNRARRGFEGKGLAIAGSITSVAALLVSVLWFTVFGVAANDPSLKLIDGACDSEQVAIDPDC